MATEKTETEIKNSKLNATIQGGLNEKNQFSGSFVMEAPQRPVMTGAEKALLAGGAVALGGCAIKACCSGFLDVAEGIDTLRTGETL